MKNWSTRCTICGKRFNRHKMTVMDKKRQSAGMVRVKDEVYSTKVKDRGKLDKVKVKIRPHVWVKRWDSQNERYMTSGKPKRGWTVGRG